MTFHLEQTAFFRATADFIASDVAMARASVYAIMVAMRRHLRSYARTHHGSAQALGATPTRNIEAGAAAMTVEEKDGMPCVNVPVPGFRRAFGPVDIRARNAGALTIPINRVAYGKRAAEVARLGFRLFTRGKRQGGENGVLYGKEADGTETALYLLRRRVRIRQDASLMPDERELSDAAHRGAASEIRTRRAS